MLKQLWKRFFYLFEKLGLHIYPVHYYSQIPDTRDLRQREASWSGRKDFEGLDLDPAAWVETLSNITQMFRSEHETFGPYEEEVQRFGWGGYGAVEAFVYYCVIRTFKPKRIIEVGSGISALYSLRALDKNEGGSVLAIDPYPCTGLRQLADRHERLQLNTGIVQNVELDRFEELESGDILFIDSTHTVKIGGDVNFLMLDVLPRLGDGVIVQFHDIPWPKRSWDPFKDNMFWQEPEFLQAFLAFNKGYKILMSQAWIHLDFPDVFKNAFHWYDPELHYPSSLYIQRIDS